jgi:cation-transporting P-type ATPase C
LDGFSEEEVVRNAAVAERLSEHPLGKAITARAKDLGQSVPDAEEFRVVPGQGVVARLLGKQIVVGTEQLLREHQIDLPETASDTMSDFEKEGLTPLLVTSSGKAIGVIGVADTVREEMSQAIRNLRDAGVKKVVMLTGDSPEVAKRVAADVGIDEWHARLLPEQKVNVVRRLQQDGYKVAMLGDGINDAPALAQADVGVAMGVAGTDVAMETADIVLMTDDAFRAAEAINLSRHTLRVIRLNLGFALFFNLIGIAAAASGALSPIGAALFHNLGSVAVVVNSARLVGARKLS